MKTRALIANREAGGANERVRVNIRTLVNLSQVRKEKRNGREVVIVPSATLPDNVVMNGILYPPDEIAKSFHTLNRTPAPAGHPMVNNAFVSARDPEGINRGWIGAWNENVRRENGRVFLDKVIDVEVAGQSERGRAVLNAIERGDPVHTSTGLLADLEPAEEGAEHQFIARNMEFDHDAILVSEEGAATPEQGVGMLVNSNGEQKEIKVVNSAIESADRELDWALDHVLEAYQRRQRAPLVERLKTAFAELLGTEREPTINGKEETMPITDEQFKALSEKVETLSDGFSKIGDTVTNAVAAAVKPMADNLEAIQANQKKQEEAELSELRDKIVKANIMDAEAAKELTLNTARALAKKADPGKAAALNGAGFGSDEDPWAGYDLNAAIDGDKKKEG